MIKRFTIFLFLLISSQLFAQIDEVGGGIGGMTYTGDLVRGYKLLSNRPAGTIFVRRNLNDFVSFKFGVAGGKITASDATDPIDAFAAQRNSSFNITLMEFSIMVEYHFLNFKSGSPRERWSPYFTGGVALIAISGNKNKPEPYSNFQPSVPLGFGVKYIVNPKWMIGFEWGARMLFFDYLDNVSEGDLQKKNYQYGNWYDNDAYYYIGFSLNYAFYRIPCPFPYN